MRALREERYIVSYLGFRSPSILQTLLHIGHTPFICLYSQFSWVGIKLKLKCTLLHCIVINEGGYDRRRQLHYSGVKAALVLLRLFNEIFFSSFFISSLFSSGFMHRLMARYILEIMNRARFRSPEDVKRQPMTGMSAMSPQGDGILVWRMTIAIAAFFTEYVRQHSLFGYSETRSYGLERL